MRSYLFFLAASTASLFAQSNPYMVNEFSEAEAFRASSSYSDGIPGPALYYDGSGAGRSVHIGDFNGDGIQDFLNERIFSVKTGYVWVPVKNHPNGGYNVPTYENKRNIQIHLSNGNGTFTTLDGPAITNNPDLQKYTRLFTADFNGDGRTDLMMANGWNSTLPTTIYLANGDGSFTRRIDGPAVYMGQSAAGVQVDLARIKIGDFDGDGKADIAVIQGWGNAPSCQIFLSYGNSFSQAIPGPAFYVGNSLDGALLDLSRIKVADFNGDKFADLLSINGWDGNAAMHYFPSGGNGSFRSAQPGPVVYIGRSIAGAMVDVNRIKLGDFNGDGKMDIIAINGWGNAPNSSVFLSNGNSFNPGIAGPAFYTGNSYEGAQLDLSRCRIADLNGDGSDDILWNPGWGGVAAQQIFISNRNGTFQPAVSGPMLYVGSTIPNAQADVNRDFLGDFNGDRKMDILHLNGWNNAEQCLTFLSTLP